MNGNMLNYVDGTWAKPMQVETYGQLQCHMSGFNVHAHQMDDCKLWAHIICRPDLPGSYGLWVSNIDPYSPPLGH